MRRPRAELETKLMQVAQEVVTELLDWAEATQAPNLTQIEEEILSLRKRLSEEMAETVIEAQEATRPVPGPHCSTCGREMSYKDIKPNTVESRVGSLTLERGYYYCPTCQAGLFPPG